MLKCELITPKQHKIVKEVKKMKMDVKNKGITLISLVITIIILLILAGISISMLTRR